MTVSQAPRSAELVDLIARVEAATGPDREIDVALFAHLLKPVEWIYLGASAGTLEYRVTSSHTPRYHPVHAYTASVDAALALCERVLPDHRGLMLFETESGAWGAHWQRPATETGYAFSPALALTLAMLRALEGRS